LSDEIWFVGNAGLIRFNPQLQSRQAFFLPYLDEESLIELFIENNVIWALTREGIFYYEKQSGVWKEFEGNNNLLSREIIGGGVNTQQIWVLTNQNVLVWHRDQKSWEILDYSSGLTASDYESVYSDGELTILFKLPQINYRKSGSDSWRKFQLATEAAGSGENVFRNLFDNPDGGYVQIADYRWSFQGTRVNFLNDSETKYIANTTQHTATAVSRLDVKSQIDLGNSRRVTGFYNNVDYAETMYGVRFRGNDGDVTREFNWGDFSRDPGLTPFGETAEIFGANAWLQYGEKTSRFKRSLLALKASTGEVRSKKTYEYYTGASTEFSKTIRDVDYAKNQFFSLRNIDSLYAPNNVQIFVDDLISSDNTPNTLVGLTIAGVRGDFDEWKPTEDFYFYRKANVVRLVKSIGATYTVVARYSVHDQIRETVLQSSNSSSTVQQNFYFLNAQQIIPYSMQLRILDSMNRDVPLGTFGIDDDGDDHVDSRFLDFERGILFFPSSRPFPSEVYDPTSPRSHYRIAASFQTELSIIQLQQHNLVRGSEKLWLDGVLATGGNDYVLDYTNGTLIFVREGLLSSDTRIEIEYEYYETSDNNLHTASLNYSPSDNFFAQGDWQKTTKDSVNLFTLHSEIRQPIGGFDLKITPALAYQGDKNDLSATSLDGLLSTSTFRFQTSYQSLSKDYRNLYHPQAIFGNIKNRLRFFTSYDVREDLRLSGEWKKTDGYSSLTSNSPTDRSGTATVLFHHQDLPAVQFNFYKDRTTTDESTSDKWFLQGLIEYQVPKSFAESILLSSLRVESYLKYGFQTNEAQSFYSKRRFFNSYYKINSIISDQFQLGFFYRSNKIDDATSAKQPISNSERLLADLTYGELRAIQLNLRAENNLLQYAHKNSSLRDYNLRQFYQVNVRLSPGQVFDALSSLFFELNYNQSLNQSGIKDGSAGSFLWKLTATNLESSENFSLARTYYIKNEFRPSSRWYLFSMFEWNTQEVGASAGRLDKSSYRLSEKLDMKLSLETRLVTEFKHFNQDLSFGRTTRDYEPSIWLEHRWTPDLINTVNLRYRRRNANDGRIENVSNDWVQTVDLIWQKNNFIGMRYIELQQTLAGETHRTYGSAPQRSYQFSSGSSINAYPMQSLIVRFRMDLTYYWDKLIAGNDYTVLAFSLKMSLQL
jgi:hypothetical protein